MNEWDEARVWQIFHLWDAQEILKIELPTSKALDFCCTTLREIGGFLGEERLLIGTIVCSGPWAGREQHCA
jgi:hypothetical protein